MIYRVTFTHAPDYEFVLASVKSMARLRAWNEIGGIFLFVDPARPFTQEQINTLRPYKCLIYPTPILTGVFTGVTFNWSWEGIFVQLLAYKWMSLQLSLNVHDYVMRADSDTVFTSSRFAKYASYGLHYLGKGNEQTFSTPNGPFRPTEGPCNMMEARFFLYLTEIAGSHMQMFRDTWPGLPLVDDVFFSWVAGRRPTEPRCPSISYFENNEWYTGTTLEEFQTYLGNGQLPGGGFLFHWLGHLKQPVKPLLDSVNWLPEP